MLAGGTILAGEAAVPQRWNDFVDGGTPGRNIPSVERPKMDARAGVLPDEAKPGNPSLDGFRHRSLHVEMKERLGGTGSLPGQPPTAGIILAGRTVADSAMGDKIDVDVIIVGRPVVLEMIEEQRSIWQQIGNLKIAQREGKGLVDADQ